MTKRYYLIRHGEKIAIPGDPPLSETGIKQAQTTANHLKSLPITKVIASPIMRAQQTAQPIANQLGVTLETNALLRERINWGDDPTQSLEYFTDIWNKMSQDRMWLSPSGDSSISAGKRLEKVISDMLDDDDKQVVLVTHGGIITDFLRNIFSLSELNQYINDFESTLDNNIKECSVTIIDVNTENPRYTLIALASTNHLTNI